MDNTALYKLILQALQSSEAAEVLALAIDQLPEIRRYLGEGWLPYYEKALPRTERDVKRSISKFPQMYHLNLETIDCQNLDEAANVRKKFISWVMMILKRDCHDVKRGKPPKDYSIDELIRKGEGSATIGDITPDSRVSGIEALLVNELKKISRQIQEYIQLDPDHLLRGCHVRGRLDVNCQALLKLRLLYEPRLTLEDIAQKLQVPLQTIKSRLERNCLPLIKNVALKLGYE